LTTPVAQMLGLPAQSESSGGPLAARRPTRKASLLPADQRICPVTKALLGSMGAPVSVEVGERKVWLCCSACEPKIKAEPAEFLANLPPPESANESAALTPEEQGVCPVTGAKLGSMGEPIAVEVEGRKVWVCCAGCPEKLQAEPAKYLARLSPAPRDQVLSVPESAVVDTGKRKVVYVESEPGVFEGREVLLGPRVGNRYPVIEGLFPGEKVAATGAFLIDAESRINPAVVEAENGRPKSAAGAERSATAPAPSAHRH